MVMVMMQMFDEDKSGHIDEDEFFFLLQYLGIEVGRHTTYHIRLLGFPYDT